MIQIQFFYEKTKDNNNNKKKNNKKNKNQNKTTTTTTKSKKYMHINIKQHSYLYCELSPYNMLETLEIQRNIGDKKLSVTCRYLCT